MKYKIFTDGGARGNPGPAGIGVQVLEINGMKAETERTIYEQASYIGRSTNNEAEYKALLAALEWLRDDLKISSKIKNKKQTPSEAEFFLDSKLVVEQVLKNWKIKAPGLKDLLAKTWSLLDEINDYDIKVTLKHVRRENNKVADSLVNRALDAR